MTAAERRAERGSATVLVLGIVASVLVLLSALVLLGRAAGARAAAQTAADLAALAGAAAVADVPVRWDVAAGPDPSPSPDQTPSPDPCARAGVVARANGADLVACARLIGGHLRVEVRVGGARATARAGPVGTPGVAASASPRESAPTSRSHALQAGRVGVVLEDEGEEP